MFIVLGDTFFIKKIIKNKIINTTIIQHLKKNNNIAFFIHYFKVYSNSKIYNYILFLSKI
jgi:hypothetical protein